MLGVEGVSALLSLDGPLWTDNLLAKRRRAAYGGTGGRRFSHRPRDAAAEREVLTLFSKAGSNASRAPPFAGVRRSAARALGKLTKRMLDTEHAGEGTTSVGEPVEGGCQNGAAAVDGGVLVVSGREPAPVFEAVECSLDDGSS
jgi:hypothetical protein